MKKLIILFAIVIAVFITSDVFAQLRETTDRLTADTLIYTKRYGQDLGICGVYAEADGTNAATCVIHDNTSATGKTFPSAYVPAGEYRQGYMLSYCLKASTGLYLNITGTNAACWIIYTR